ncbi:SDR family NAD(P)-dependent oxidoreductase [Methylobacterium sp. WSM2598]|uniref:SDR family NAD(P)-dependent oxidoreductase n=1 Tax=Methylobacterium sp. WSM2598 TaxID=398261 RepID=UPI00037D3FDB|nr:SDR family NAD(P)-dependent oxidoreductase [Methylobacterium sp. WSM2598]
MLPIGSTAPSLTGMTALVIGGSSGIGEAAAHGFARAGARIAIAARRPETLDAALDQLRALSPAARASAADVTEPGAAPSLAGC